MGYGPPEPPPPPRPRYGWLIALVIAVTLAGGGLVSVALVTTYRATHPTANQTASTLPGGSVAAPSAGSPSLPSPGGAAGDPSAITAAVDPTVVNINTTLGLQQARAAGTGIVLTASGEVLTNNHVIDGATSITATDVGNGKTYQATVVGYDRSEDLAVIQLQGASQLPTASIGDSSRVSPGDGIVAIGNAGGQGGTPAAVTGTVTDVDQTITASEQDGSNAEQLTGLIEIAADIQPGDSGGPLVDLSGHVIGIDTAASSSYRIQAAGGQGFAIPINQATTVAKQIEGGKASATIHIGATAFIGIGVAAASNGSGSGNGAGGGSGIVVTTVVSGSPAEQAGLAQGDVLVSMDGTALSTPATLTTLMNGHHPGDRVTLQVVGQSGQSRSVTIHLTTGPAA